MNVDHCGFSSPVRRPLKPRSDPGDHLSQPFGQSVTHRDINNEGTVLHRYAGNQFAADGESNVTRVGYPSESP